MLKISDRAFSYLSNLNIPDMKNINDIAVNKINKKESKARGFHKKQKWNKSVTVTEKCNFNTILAILDGKIILKDEINQYEYKMLYEDPKLNYAIIFETDSDFASVRRKCRDNVRLRIVKNVETEYFKHITDFFNCGNFKILLVSSQNLQKDEEIFVSPMNFTKNIENNACVCSQESLCLYTQVNR